MHRTIVAALAVLAAPAVFAGGAKYGIAPGANPHQAGKVSN